MLLLASTQSNNMVFDSVARYYAELHAEDGGQGSLPHVIISNLEHDSVDLTARKMEEQGRIGEYYYTVSSWSIQNQPSVVHLVALPFSIVTLNI